jgi:flagellar basal-body rod modification protein FlgD
MSAINTDMLQGIGLSSTPAAKAKDKLGQEDFLKLMTTQIQNQDPFSPMQNGEFLAQMAQFGTVSGIQDLQDSFKTLAGSMTSNQSLQAASLVGHDALVNSSRNALGADGALQGAVDVPSTASDVKVKIYDPAGQLVHQLSLGVQGQGLADYQWDGTLADGSKAPPGDYVVQAEAVIGGSTVQADNLTQAKIDSVTFGKLGDGLKVSLAGIGRTDFSELREIR